MSILNTAITRHSLPSIHGYACDGAAFSVSVEDGTDTGEDGTISFDPMLSLFLSMGCSLWLRPILGHVNPLVGKTTDWRAGCARSAFLFEGKRTRGHSPSFPTRRHRS